ncbi:amino acid transporter AVT3B-like [Apium graveolens]|uniref:amino acid transporter AVT3B-like n=1 Tax=Apium graveolens TaxID=4045 RepID=UPI003D7BA0DD
MEMDKKTGPSSTSSVNNSNVVGPTEDTPLLEHKDALSSQPKTFANVFIAVVGAGVLGLPYTFSRTGWLTGSIMILAAAALTNHCMMLLVYTRRKLQCPFTFSNISSFGDLGFAVCGSPGRFAVDLMVILTQAGFCIGYTIFIGNTLAHLFANSYHYTAISPKTIYIWSTLPFQLGLNAIPTLTLLAPLSIFADVIQIGAMCVVLVEDVRLFMTYMPPVKPFGSLSWSLYGLGVAVYSFEGVGQGWLSTVVQLSLCVNLLITLPLMMQPVYEVFERRFWEGCYCLWIRWLLVLVLILIALMVPNFTDFLSLVGSSTCCVLGFVLPALFHYLTFKDEMGPKEAYKDIGIIALGITLGVLGTWSSLSEIASSS